MNFIKTYLVLCVASLVLTSCDPPPSIKSEKLKQRMAIGDNDTEVKYRENKNKTYYYLLLPSKLTEGGPHCWVKFSEDEVRTYSNAEGVFFYTLDGKHYKYFGPYIKQDACN